MLHNNFLGVGGGSNETDESQSRRHSFDLSKPSPPSSLHHMRTTSTAATSYSNNNLSSSPTTAAPIHTPPPSYNSSSSSTTPTTLNQSPALHRGISESKIMIGSSPNIQYLVTTPRHSVDQLDNVGGDMNLMLMMMDQSIMNTSSNLRSSLKYNDHRDANRNAPKSVLIQNIIHDLVEELTAIIDSDSKIQLNYQQLGSIDLTSIMSNTSVVNLQHASVGNPHSSIGSLLNPQPSFSGLFASGSNSTTPSNNNTSSGLIGSNSGLIGNMMMTGSASLTTNLKEHEQDKYTNIYFNNSYSLKLLFKYHNDPTTKSYIYREILKRMQDHEDNITILLYCLQLLKTILTTFKRDDKLLDHYKNIYYYCKDVLSRKHVNANLQSQVQFIIKYIYRHLIKILQRNQLYIMNMLNYDKRISGLTSRIFEYYLYKNRLFNNEILKLYQQESNTVRRQLSTLENNPTSYSTNNSIMDFIYFGSQFRKFTKFEDKQAEIDLSNKILNIENMDTIKHQIESIQNEINPYASSPIIHDLLLPNISQYIDQYYEYKDNNNRYIQSIVENDEQFNTILNQIIIGCNNDEDDTKLNDASLLFVMMISNTIYGSESTNRLTMKQLNSFFMEMLDSNNSTSIFNAFKILFNIYHYNLKLYEQYQNISSIELVLSDLFIKFCDMVTTFHMMMMDDDSIYEQIRLITSEILVYFLYHHFIIYNTAPSTRNILIIELNPQLLVDQLDIRVVYDMILFHLNHIDESQDAHFDLLIALLCFQINQNMKLLDKLPNGVTSLIDIYTIYNHVLNMNSKYNLFLILFDHVIDRNLPSIDPIQRDLLFLLFDKSNIPIYCHYLFKYLPTIDKQNTFIRQLSKFLYVDFVMKNDHIIPYIKNNLDMECMMKFLIGLQRLSCNYLENQFKPYVNHLLSNTSPSNLNIMDTLLKDLLFDLNDEQNRRQGEHLLFNIVKFNEDFVIENIINTSNYYSNLRNKMNQLLNDMIQHENEQIRMIYLNILEKKILLLKSKCTTHGDSERVKSMIKTLNESLLECIVNRKETNSLNLIKAFHLVFDFISICTFPHSYQQVYGNSQPQDAAAHANKDTTTNNKTSATTNDNSETFTPPLYHQMFNMDLCEMFLNGHVSIPYYLLKDISISILYYLFESLHSHHQQSHQLSSISSILLILIIEKCNRSKQVLASIGGLTFFKNLLQHEKYNATILYYTSKYLMKQLSQSFPNEYYNYLSNLILKAQSENLPNLLQNPYNPFFI